MTGQAHRAIAVGLTVTTIHFNNVEPSDLQAVTADDRTVMPLDAREAHGPDRSVAEVAEDVLWLHVLGIRSFTMHRSALLHQCHRSEVTTFGHELPFEVCPHDFLIAGGVW